LLVALLPSFLWSMTKRKRGGREEVVIDPGKKLAANARV
jgi:hypothetical protein